MSKYMEKSSTDKVPKSENHLSNHMKYSLRKPCTGGSTIMNSRISQNTYP